MRTVALLGALVACASVPTWRPFVQWPHDLLVLWHVRDPLPSAR